MVIAGLDLAIHLLRKAILRKIDGCPDQVRAWQRSGGGDASRKVVEG